MSEQLDVATLAWCAGFFDGEGSIGIARRLGGRSHVLRVSMAQSVERPITLFRESFGGWAYSHEGKRTPNQRPYWFWYAEARAAAAMLRAIRPHLIVKADQSDIALEFYDSCPRWGNRSTPLTPAEIDRRESYRLRLVELHGGNGKRQPLHPWSPEREAEVAERRRQDTARHNERRRQARLQAQHDI